ncbi:phosphatidylinositol 4,5-bisphosphate 5-phosphatase A [Clupea harengus]|uniref:Phosphatidylinositol 4,5-bisphosphate 5-phosphatase A n=1 Tax=Clupea harengus TaxID=7950 RepID=A0A6P8H035_CLUHA|nr:phosphatidylinositol 4,5-bisphosphate 5-phosphatase A [Clupea harengus]
MDPMQRNQSCSFSKRVSDPFSTAMSPASGPIGLPPPCVCPAPVPRTQPAAAAARTIQLSPAAPEAADVSGTELCLRPPVSISRPRPTALGMGMGSAPKALKNPESIPRPKASVSPLPAGSLCPLGHTPPESSQPRCPPSSRSPQSNRSPQQSSPSQTILIPPPSSAAYPHLSSQPSAVSPARGSSHPNLNTLSGVSPPRSSHPKSSQSYLSSQLRVSPEPQPPLSEGTRGKTDKASANMDDFRVQIVTWNVGSAVPPDDITSLFGSNLSSRNVDMFVVGLQEVNSMINKRLKDALFTDQWSDLCMETLSRFGYVLVASQRMQGVLLLVFSKFCHLPFLRGVQTQSTRTGLGGCWGNKGGVSARMMMFGHPVCFLNCHLPAHMRNLEQRMEDFESILQQQQFEGGTAPGVLDHDVVFWFGDLNFRIEDYDIHVVKSAIDSSKLSLLWERDQLNMAKNSAPILEGFMESTLNFPPTYKFDVGTHTYDTSAKKRKPAWTDRILWRLRRTGSPVPSHNANLQRGLTSWLGGVTRVTQHSYRSHMGFTISDHKPVSAVFSLHFPFRVSLPLVTLEVEKEWTKVSDATVQFEVASTFQRSSWDWVGLYKVGFKHHKDYVAYVWAKSDHLPQVTFPEEDLPRDSGGYILGYYSHNMNSIVGMTEPFQVQLPVVSPPAPAPHSESSEESSEDDSTLVLLAPNTSRSPSPGTHSGKRAHRRQRSRSPAVPRPRHTTALSASSLPTLQSLSLCPRPRDGQVRTPSPRSPRNGCSTSSSSTSKKERLICQDSSPSPCSPISPRSPVSPRGGVSTPEALIVAMLGPAQAQALPGPAADTCL